MRRSPTLAIALLLAACGGPDRDYVFALVPKAMQNPFFEEAHAGCRKAAKELGVECLYVGPGEHEEEEQVRIVENLITRGVDGIAVSPSNAPAVAQALRRALAAGIPAITWDSDLLPQDRHLRAAYVGTHNYQVGVEQAQIVKRLKPEGGTLCIQSGGPSASNHNERMHGIRDTLGGSPSAVPPGARLEGKGGWTEAEGCPLYSNDDLALAVSQIEDVLARMPDLDALIVTGGFPQFVDDAYRRVVEKHFQRIWSARTVIVAADTLPMQMALLRDGLSHGQVGQRPFEMGYRAIQVLRDLREGRPVSDPVHTGIDLCLPSNVETCLEPEPEPGPEPETAPAGEAGDASDEGDPAPAPR